VAAYVALVVLFMSNAEKIIDQTASSGFAPPVIIGSAMLLLFVLSAAVTGALVLGRPILLYLDGQKTDAIRLFLYTLAWLAFWFLAAIFLISII